MHPGVGDLSDMTEPQLEEKIFQLNRYYHITPNEDVRQQMILVLDDYKLELEKRRLEQKKKLQDQGNNDLDNLINVS